MALRRAGKIPTDTAAPGVAACFADTLMGLRSLAKPVGNLTDGHLPWGDRKGIVRPQHRGDGLQFGGRVTAVKHSKLTEKLKRASKRTCFDLANEEGLA